MSWHPFDNGKSIGQQGSESGVIIRDEEHAGGARITLERQGYTAPFAITCGIYGWMVHTRFFGSEAEAQAEFKKMRIELTEILSNIPSTTDSEADAKSRIANRLISEFVERFP
jgi:hypothetical protein